MGSWRSGWAAGDCNRHGHPKLRRGQDGTDDRILTPALQRTPASADTDHRILRLTEEVVLRIDETSKTLVAPQAGGFVTEDAPERDELLALVASGWTAFAAELGHHSMHLCATQPVPGLDLLAFDEQAGRVVIAQVVGGDPEHEIGRALTASSAVAGWDAGALAGMHESLE